MTLARMVLYLMIWACAAEQGFAQSDDCVNQSPRDLTPASLESSEQAPRDNYNFFALLANIKSQWVRTGPPLTIHYKKIVFNNQVYRNGDLKLCDQHYHFPVENIQGCDGEKPSSRRPSRAVSSGDWIEVHNVYAYEANVDGDCANGLDHELACCVKGPYVVHAFSAQVVGEDRISKPLVDPPGELPSAEWTGSKTGPPNEKDPSPTCKYQPVQWSFRLGCSFQVSPGQLSGSKTREARELQSGGRLSNDLTFVGQSMGQVEQTVCRPFYINRQLTQQQANEQCPSTCPRSLPYFSSALVTRDNVYTTCTCCPQHRDFAR